jgi:hypothetical protein
LIRWNDVDARASGGVDDDDDEWCACVVWTTSECGIDVWDDDDDDDDDEDDDHERVDCGDGGVDFYSGGDECGGDFGAASR